MAVYGALHLDAPTGGTIDLVADGATIWLELPGAAAARALMPRSFRARSRTVRALADTLDALRLTLRLSAGGRPVGELGRGSRPNWLARLLGLAPARLRLGAIWLLLKR